MFSNNNEVPVASFTPYVQVGFVVHTEKLFKVMIMKLTIGQKSCCFILDCLMIFSSCSSVVYVLACCKFLPLNNHNLDAQIFRSI